MSQHLPAPSSFAELLRERATHEADRLAYSFLVDGESQTSELTYGETDRRARSVACALLDDSVAPGERALLLIPPGLDYICALFGCLYAGVIAVPVYPPNLSQEASLSRLNTIATDADVTVAITTSPLIGFVDELARHAPALGHLNWLSADDTYRAFRDDSDPTVPSPPERTVILQYTSGSTAAPRGVGLTNANLLHNSDQIQRTFRADRESRAMVWLPPYHDMGLIGGLLQPLYGGFPAQLMSPLHFLEKPIRWLRAISRFRATASGGPNFAYDLCARRHDPQDIAELDLSSWQVAFNGAEPVRPDTLDRFAATFAQAGFRPGAFLPCYGLAEATLLVCGTGGLSRNAPDPGELPTAIEVDPVQLQRHHVTRPEGARSRLIACGASPSDQRIVIVDPRTLTPCKPNRVGEIWIQGPGVADGYWGNPDLTDRTFNARLANGDGPFLVTGDLGFLHEGQLVVTGRSKDLIIVRGRNHYPQDLEHTSETADPLLRSGGAAAFSLTTDSESDESLVVVQELKKNAEHTDLAAMAARIRQAIARDHGLQVHLVLLTPAGAIPKTSSGKIQRSLCREQLVSGALRELARSHVPDTTDPAAKSSDANRSGRHATATTPATTETELATRLRQQVAELTGCHPATLDDDTPLLSYGLDSLATIRLRHQLADAGLDLPLSALLSGATVSNIVSRASPSRRQVTPSEATSDTTNGAAEAPLSPSQHWMWFLQQLEPGSPAYNISAAMKLIDPLDTRALRGALEALVARHESLRTTFPQQNSRPIQRIHAAMPIAFREHTTEGIDDKTLQQVLTRASRRPFDLEAGPLLRADLYRHKDGQVLLITIHHMVADFWSLSLLATEFGQHYSALVNNQVLHLPSPEHTYADLARWQRSWVESSDSKPAAEYWESVIGEGLPRLTFPKPKNPAQPGGSARFTLDATFVPRLRDSALAENTTPFVLLLAAFQAALHHITEQNELAIGISTAGRTRPEFTDVIGCCTRVVIAKSRHEPHERLSALLARTKSQFMEALEYQDYPVTHLNRRRSGRPSSLVDALLAYNRSPDPSDTFTAATLTGAGTTPLRLGPITVETIPLPDPPGLIPLQVLLTETGGALHGILRYRGDVIDAATAGLIFERFADRADAIATAVTATASQPHS